MLRSQCWVNVGTLDVVTSFDFRLNLGSGIWSGIFAGIAGALGLMNIKPLLNGFLACSLISVATSTLALALTGIGLVRDYNISQQDPVSGAHKEIIIYGNLFVAL